MFRFRSREKRAILSIHRIKIFALFLLLAFFFSGIVEAEGMVKVAVLPLVEKEAENAYWGYFLRDIIKMGLEEEDEI